MEPQEQVTYMTPQSPTQRITLSTGTKQAVAGVITLTQEEAAELEEMIEKHQRADLRQACVKINMAQAAAVVQKHKSKERPAAVAGAMHSGADPKAEITQAVMAQNSDMLRAQEALGLEIAVPGSEEGERVIVAEPAKAPGKLKLG